MAKGPNRWHSCASLQLLCALLLPAALRGIQPLARWLALWARLWTTLVLVYSHADCLQSGDYAAAAARLDAAMLVDLNHPQLGWL